jgi:hypothetical protein
MKIVLVIQSTFLKGNSKFQPQAIFLSKFRNFAPNYNQSQNEKES